LQNGSSLALSPDQQFLYIGSTGEGPISGGVAWFAVDEAQAAPTALTVEHHDVVSLAVDSAGGSDTVRLRDSFTLQSDLAVIIPVTIEYGSVDASAPAARGWHG